MLNTDSSKQANVETTTPPKFTSSPFFRVVKYLVARISAILLTIILGVFIMVIFANRRGMIDYISTLKAEKDILIMFWGWGSDKPTESVEQVRQELYEKMGLNLPFWPRHLLWTYKALTLDWGDIWDKSFQVMDATQSFNADSRFIILHSLPNTLLLVGVSYFFLFCVGVPASLRLSQRPGTWLDRVFSTLTPLSSVPSWVIGILLVMFFAVQLKILPPGKMYDNTIPPDTSWGTILVVIKHTILPVTAIVLGMLFQLTYTWRTFLTIYADEDYVELGKAKGLPLKILARKYILRPTLPYMLTSFALTLVGFWQATTALEYFFDWPGIGRMYVLALPNFNGESMYAGEMTLVVGIVVLFAYLLGLAVFILDILYILVDPRLRLAGQGETVRLSVGRKQHLAARVKTKPWRELRTMPAIPAPLVRKKFSFSNWMRTLKVWYEPMKPAVSEIKHSPAAILGLTLVSFLVLASLITVVALPYKEYGRQWSIANLGKKILVPKLALPSWVNWFRKNDLPSTIILA